MKAQSPYFPGGLYPAKYPLIVVSEYAVTRAELRIAPADSSINKANFEEQYRETAACPRAGQAAWHLPHDPAATSAQTRPELSPAGSVLILAWYRNATVPYLARHIRGPTPCEKSFLFCELKGRPHPHFVLARFLLWVFTDLGSQQP